MTNYPKVIGLLGGMSWPSTVTYYREINTLVNRRLGASHSARILIWSDDYQQVEQMQLSKRWQDAGHWLAEGARRLEAGGADLLGIACNTMHKVAYEVRKSSALPFIDLIEAAARAPAEFGCRHTAVLGTNVTASMGRYEEELARHGILCSLPTAEDQAIVDRIIYNELCRGVVEQPSRAILQSVMARLADAGADSVVLACTELNLLVDDDVNGGRLRIIDSSMAHIHALVDAALALPSE